MSEMGLEKYNLLSRIAGEADQISKTSSAYPVTARYLLGEREIIDALRTKDTPRVIFTTSIPGLSFNTELLSGAIFGAKDVGESWIEASYPHYRDLRLPGNITTRGIVGVSVFAGRYEQMGRVLARCYQALGLDINDLDMVLGLVMASQTMYQSPDGEMTFPGYGINDAIVRKIILDAEDYLVSFNTDKEMMDRILYKDE